jgi:mannose-6-phosphate isomerase-like protein (cupin superfamily)
MNAAMSSFAFSENILELTRRNNDFRREIITNQHSQLVIMCIQPGDDIGKETHHVDQLLVFVEGSGDAFIGGARMTIGEGSIVIVPAGTLHNFHNTGRKPLKLFTIYAPPEEAPGTLHRTKAEALMTGHPPG